MSIFSLVFVHLDTKQIYLWMEAARSRDEALLLAQEAFEKLKVDPKRLNLSIAKEFRIDIRCTHNQPKQDKPNIKEVEEYEAWKTKQRGADQGAQEETRAKAPKKKAGSGKKGARQAKRVAPDGQDTKNGPQQE